MTDRLATLLHDAADDLDAGFPPAAAVLAQGRRRRRRRTTGLVAAASAVVAAGLVGALLLPGGADRAVDPVAPPPDPFDGISFAIGNDVYLDGGESVVEIDDRAIKSLYYSSAGIVVRHGDNANSDGGGPQRFTLVRPDGTTSPVSVETEDNAHGVDADQPLLAWTEVVPGGVEVVVHDVEADAEVARVPVEGSFEWSPPPVALDGDVVYVGGTARGGPTLVVDWRTAEVGEAPNVPSFPDVVDGRAVTFAADGSSSVVSVGTGEEVGAVGGAASAPSLSPDGRHVLGGEVVVDLDSGDEVELQLPSEIADDPALAALAPTGWGAEGQVVVVGDGVLTSCSPETGRCESREVEALAGEPDVRITGVLFES